MAFVRGFPSGAGFNDVYPSATFNTTDEQWLRALDIVDGDSYTMSGSAPVFIDATLSQFIIGATGGYEFAFDGTSGGIAAIGKVAINTATVPTALGETNIGGTVRLRSGCSVTALSGSGMGLLSGGTFAGVSGSEFTLLGKVALGTGSLPVADGVNLGTAHVLTGNTFFIDDGAGLTVTGPSGSLGVGGTLLVTGTASISAGTFQTLGASTVTIGSSTTATNHADWTNTGVNTNSGSGRIVKRYRVITDSDNGTTFTVSTGELFRCNTLAGGCTVTLGTTGATEGTEMEFSVDGMTGGFTLTVRNSVGVSLGAMSVGSVGLLYMKVVFDGSEWIRFAPSWSPA